MKNKPTTKQFITFEPTKGKKVLRVPALNLQCKLILVLIVTL